MNERFKLRFNAAASVKGKSYVPSDKGLSRALPPPKWYFLEARFITCAVAFVPIRLNMHARN